jgi:hypothetical protein
MITHRAWYRLVKAIFLHRKCSTPLHLASWTDFEKREKGSPSLAEGVLETAFTDCVMRRASRINSSPVDSEKLHFVGSTLSATSPVQSLPLSKASICTIEAHHGFDLLASLGQQGAFWDPTRRLGRDKEASLHLRVDFKSCCPVSCCLVSCCLLPENCLPRYLPSPLPRIGSLFSTTSGKSGLFCTDFLFNLANSRFMSLDASRTLSNPFCTHHSPLDLHNQV